jgi:hypothetical protein
LSSIIFNAWEIYSTKEIVNIQTGRLLFFLFSGLKRKIPQKESYAFEKTGKKRRAYFKR